MCVCVLLFSFYCCYLVCFIVIFRSCVLLLLLLLLFVGIVIIYLVCVCVIIIIT